MDGWSEKFNWTPAGGSGRKFCWRFWNGPRLGELEVFFVGKRESEALGKMDGDVGGWSEGGCPSVKRIGPGLGECVEWMLGGINGQPTAHRFQNQGCPLIRTETPVLKDEIYC